MNAMEERRDGWTIKPPDVRGPFDVDYGRIVHSSSFRRLQGKTQILNLGDSDFYRTRLTHSLEVAQIGVGILNVLRSSQTCDSQWSDWLPEPTLIHSICLIHDLGHPPFGHGGEVALNYCMRDHGGFEGNAQTLRILAKLEKFSPHFGSNLTRRCLLGVLKYPASYGLLKRADLRPRLYPDCTIARLVDGSTSKPPKCYFDEDGDVVDWLLDPFTKCDRALFQAIDTQSDFHSKTKHQSLDCSIMNLADDIAYGVHDLEDAIAIGLIGREELEASLSREKWKDFLESHECFKGEQGWPELLSLLYADSSSRKRAISRIVGYLITGANVEQKEGFDYPLLQRRATLPSEKKALLKHLKDVVHDLVIGCAQVRHLEAKGQRMVLAVFEALNAEPLKLLPDDFRRLYRNAGQAGGARVISDYVAGMTDNHLLRLYERLYAPRMGSVFDRL